MLYGTILSFNLYCNTLLPQSFYENYSNVANMVLSKVTVLLNIIFKICLMCVNDKILCIISHDMLKMKNVLGTGVYKGFDFLR